MFVINKSAVISNLYLDLCAFFRVPLNVLVRTPAVTRTSGWESLLYMMFYEKSLTLFNGLSFPHFLSTFIQSWTD